MNDISNLDDTIDIRDVIARVEELEDKQPLQSDVYLADLDSLKALLEECKGNGGDEEWDGNWYPGYLIRDSYFEDYARQLADDVGAVPDGLAWPCRCIDWGQAARELKMDYTSVEFDGVTYWVR